MATVLHNRPSCGGWDVRLLSSDYTRTIVFSLANEPTEEIITELCNTFEQKIADEIAAAEEPPIIESSTIPK
jgi:hypothetical protein